MCSTRSIEALSNRSIYYAQIFEQWCQVVFSMKSIKEGLTILMVKDNTFKLWSNVLLKWKAFGWYELRKKCTPIDKYALVCLVGLNIN